MYVIVSFFIHKCIRTKAIVTLNARGFLLHLSVNKKVKDTPIEIVFCWNNCSCYSQEKCFECNLIFPQVIEVEKGQQVKGFRSQGRKKGTEGKVFEAKAVGWGLKMFTSCPSFFKKDALG